MVSTLIFINTTTPTTILVYLPSFLMSARGAGELSASATGRPLYWSRRCGEQKNFPQTGQKPLVQSLQGQVSPCPNIHVFVTDIFKECAYRTLK